MPLAFVDADGHRGRITDDFSVEYGGPLAIDTYVQSVVAEMESHDGTIEELIIGMVQDLEVDEIERTASPPSL